jgi:hypothetical protein
VALSLAPVWWLAAEPVADLYVAEVTAADRGEQALGDATREGLRQVLVKVSGSREILNNPAIAPALRNPRDYMESYAYRPAATDEDGVGVRFQFAGSAVTELVTAAGAPVWTANRPAVLAWLAAKGAREPGAPAGVRLVGQDAEPEVADALATAFFIRGVPVRLPEQPGAPSADRVWEASSSSVRAASEPYELDDVLVGRVTYDEEGRASGQWSYLYEGQKRDRSVRSTSEQQFMQAGVDLAADAMAERLAVAPTSDEAVGLLVSVTGISRYGDYARLVNWLEQLELVEQANLVHIAGDEVELRVIAQIDATQLAGLIAMNRQLVPLPGVEGAERLSYQWQN